VKSECHAVLNIESSQISCCVVAECLDHHIALQVASPIAPSCLDAVERSRIAY
jgi:hypothetical protein